MLQALTCIKTMYKYMIWLAVLCLVPCICLFLSYNLTMFEIVPGLFLSNCSAAQRSLSVLQNGITCILNLGYADLSDDLRNQDVTCIRLVSEDGHHSASTLFAALPTLMPIIRAHIDNGGAVLCCC